MDRKSYIEICAQFTNPPVTANFESFWRERLARGRRFESQHRIMDGHFSHLFVVKIV